jgi:hypothetical protein
MAPHLSARCQVVCGALEYAKPQSAPLRWTGRARRTAVAKTWR